MNKKSLTVLVVVLALALIAVSVLFSLEKSSGAQLSAEIEMLTADAEAKGAEIASLTADAEARNAEIESLTADLENREAEIASLSAALEGLQAPPGPPADVADAFDGTRYFLQACEAKGLRCRYLGSDTDGDDCIVVAHGDLIPFSVRVWFVKNSSRAPFLIWHYIHFSAIDRPDLIELCNRLNKKYPDVTFLVDDWDNSVSVRGVMAFSERSGGAEADFGAFLQLLQILSDTEELFLPYAQ